MEGNKATRFTQEELDGLLFSYIEKDVESESKEDWSKVERFDTSGMNDMSKLFFNIQNIPNDLDLSGWDTSNVRKMISMFSNSNFNNDSISNWDVSNVFDMSWMFENSCFNGDISNLKSENLSNDIKEMREICKEKN